MFIGREAELRFLEERYREQGNRMVVLYGREGIGKTELAGMFINDKPSLYYYAEECSEKEQKQRLAQEWSAEPSGHFYDVMESGLKNYRARNRAEKRNHKFILVIDEFHHAVRGSQEFTEALEQLCAEKHETEILVLLLSSSVNWVENDMVKGFGRAASYLSSFRKLKEWGFVELAPMFPSCSLKQCIEIYAVLGGVPKYLSAWREGAGLRENIERLLLDKNGLLYLENERFLKSELRELSVYNTILAALASGRNKLAQINQYTGFGRAKVSVYLKNLIELDIVEKVFSYETAGKDQTVKGLYRIRDFFLLFYYRYVFVNRSELEKGNAEEVYESKIAPNLREVMQLCFKKVCREYLLLMESHGRLPFALKTYGCWFGKEGTIDFAGQSEDGRWLAAFSDWKEEETGMEDLRAAAKLLKTARIDAEVVYLFGKSGFSRELRVKSGGALQLFTVDEM